MNSFDDLYTAHSARVLSTIRKILTTSHAITDPTSAAEDVSQALWLRAHAHLEAGE